MLEDSGLKNVFMLSPSDCGSNMKSHQASHVQRNCFSKDDDDDDVTFLCE